MKTPFYDIHRSFGAKMLNFHGWEMPLHYSSGILNEHLNTRTNVSLFDVSHMGRFEVKGTDAYDCLQTLVTNDISKLNNNMALYSPICYENGGIIDDLIIYMFNPEKFLIVVNASNREKDLEWIIKHLKSATIVDDITDKIALLALQGPLAQNILEKAAIVDLNLNQLKPFNFTITKIFGIQCIISRTGYTGEDGFELFFDSSKIEIWDKLIQLGSKINIKPAGLGARDTLRLEAGLMLYGNDMNENTTPLEVPLKWTVKFEKNDFIGKKALINQQINRKLVGFEVLEKRVARHRNEVLLNSKKIGFVTSGTFSPTLKKSIGFCFVPIYVNPNELIEINIGGKLYKAKVLSSTRFYKRK
ncbi:MAG TPA: glycine cleavage system aminomethyltransferase GcvT [Nitrososphaeraceae archaeon]|nr:glycine cleavage system aminomethyltransferase GcvT [Nitrososphaeraceae archaeon]